MQIFIYFILFFGQFSCATSYWVTFLEVLGLSLAAVNIATGDVMLEVQGHGHE